MTCRYKSLTAVMYFLALALLAMPLPADEQSVRPGVNRQYENPNWQQWVGNFEHRGREVYDMRHAIVAATGAGPGMAVADIGAGTGLFTRLFAPAVAPGGTVYAIDISKTFVENILRTCREQGLKNVEGIINSPRDVGLPANSIDLAFVTATYHHFEYPVSTLASIRRALRTGGRLIIIDFRREPQANPPWVMEHVRGDKHNVIREIRAAGFHLVEDQPLMRTNYFLVFGKTGQ